MAERIYILDGDSLQPMEEQRFEKEDDLQKLLAEHPHLLDGEQVSPGNPRRWLLVKREMGVPAAASESARWSLDHLLVDQDAIPTLVEVKRGKNPQVHYEIVGQMMNYAAHGLAFWTGQTLRDEFERTCEIVGLDPDDATANFLRVESDEQTDEQPDVSAFWNKVATNLAAKNLRLLFVADVIPDDLARIVEFLNAQFRDNIEALAVEIKQFKGKSDASGSALVPRVIGRTAKRPPPPSPRPNLTLDLFLAEWAESAGHAVRDAAELLINVAKENGAPFTLGKEAVTIRGTCPLWKWPISIARLYRPYESPSGAAWVCLFGTEIFSGFGEEPHPNLKGFLEEYAAKFANDAHAEYKPLKDVSPRWLFRSEHALLEQANVWAERVAEALKGLRELQA